MNFKEKTHELLSLVEQLEESEQLKKENKLASDSYFLDEDNVLCNKRDFGDARYPYAYDGLTLWAYSSGNIKIEESTFNVNLPFGEGKEPNICFFAGIKEGDLYFPISLTGLASQPNEKGIRRFTVYAPNCAYYFTICELFIACVRMFVGVDKCVHFSIYLENKTDKKIDTYISSYFNLMLSHGNYEFIETKWFRSSEVEDNGFSFEVSECIDRNNTIINYGYLARDTKDETVYSTTSHIDYNGGINNQLYNSTSLRNGKFRENKKHTIFTDTAVAGEIIPFILDKGESYQLSYSLAISNDKVQAIEKAKENYATESIDKLLYSSNNNDSFGKNIPKVNLTGFESEQLNKSSLNYFIKNVFRQAEFCSRAKNYAGSMIGIRDIFQQLEASLMWIPSYCRGKIIEALNYIGDDGRAPRQYSYPANERSLPPMDLRPFIDQGVWVISTVYTYLCYTNDFSILDEVCGYYKLKGNAVDFSNRKDSILEHLICICDYLIANIDKDTNCLHTLYGDWNDAIDGLGRTEDKDKEYGTGVSVMATLQLYKNLYEIADILKHCGQKDKAEYYLSIRKKVEQGLQKYAITTNSNGERKILHGWGDKKSYELGGFKDVDGENRCSLTSNAFWILCDMFDLDETIKKDILSVYNKLDSKYGFKTFDVPFLDNKKIGRIGRLPIGTAENGAVYIHATLFAIWSLFRIGESEKAWEQLIKILPITHKDISTTPFVMPNSYCYNEELGFDGESMSDWFTGSGCVLLKVIMWEIFGVKATLDGLTIEMPKYVPFMNGSIELKIKGSTIKIEYEKLGGERTYSIDDTNVKNIYLSNNQLKDKEFLIMITD